MITTESSTKIGEPLRDGMLATRIHGQAIKITVRRTLGEHPVYYGQLGTSINAQLVCGPLAVVLSRLAELTALATLDEIHYCPGCGRAIPCRHCEDQESPLP